MTLAPIEKHRLYQQVSEAIQHYIFENGLRRGDVLPTEVKLAHQLEVSRPTVREALKGLQMVGVLTSRKGCGHVVGELDLIGLARQFSFQIQTDGTEFQALAETRLFLEVNILPLVAWRATEEDFIRLQQAVDLLKQGSETEDRATYVAGDIAFHQTLFEASHNRLLTGFAGMVKEFFADVRRALFASEETSKEWANRDHQAICDAIREKDVRRAQELMYAHLSVYLGMREGVQTRIDSVERTFPEVQSSETETWNAQDLRYPAVPAERLYRQVAEEIKRYILDQELKKGDVLPTEVDLARQLGVSRPTVREALKGLQMVGILTSRKGCGHVVGELDLIGLARQFSYQIQAEGAEFRDLAETRVFLEVNILPLVVERATEADFFRLQQAVDLLRKGLAERDQMACIAADSGFHQALFETSRNHLLTSFADVIEVFFTHIRRALFTSDLDTRTVQQERAIHASRALRDHQAICDAIRRKEVGRARKVMYDHLSVTCPPEVVAGGLRTFTGPDGEADSLFDMGTDKCRKA